MSISIQNGAAVSRFYSDGSGELLAVFQYTSDADKWAEQCAQTEIDARFKNTLIVRANLRDGSMPAFSGAKGIEDE